MVWDKLKDFFKKQNGATVVGMALSSQVAYAQTEPKIEEQKQDKIEQAVIQEVLEGDNIYTSINGQPVHGNIYSDVKEDLKSYYDEQKEAFATDFSVKMDTIPFNEFADNKLVGSYDFSEKTVTMNYVQTENDEDIKAYVEQNYAHLSLDEQNKKVQHVKEVLSNYNDVNTLENNVLLAHEVQHMTNDKNNIYAPGLSVAQYGMLNQYDEISSKMAELLLLDKAYQDKIKQGVPQQEALQLFEKNEFKNFAFYKDLLFQKEKMNKNDFNKQMVQGVCQMWQNNYQSIYSNQIVGSMETKCDKYDAASLAIGNDKEFAKRIDLIFDGLKDNEILKQKGISVENFSKYLSENIVPLSPEVQKKADDLTLYYTGMTPDSAKDISEKMPGNQSKDAVNLLRILSGRSVPKKVAKKFVVKSDVKELTPTEKMILNKKDSYSL